MTFIQRVAFECGHYMISGPWDDRVSRVHKIGDVTVCEICPFVLTGRISESAMRQIIDVTEISPADYRDPRPEAMRGRARQLYDYRA